MASWNLNTLRFVSVMKNTPTPSSSDVRWAREILGPTWISTYPGLYQNRWLQAFWAPAFYGSKSSFEVFSGRNCVKKSMSFYWNYCKQGKALHIGASLHFFVQFIQDTPPKLLFCEFMRKHCHWCHGGTDKLYMHSLLTFISSQYCLG